MAMIVGTGIDMTDIQRFRRLSDIERVTDFFLTKSEKIFMKDARDHAQYAASIFAIKEAVIKAIPEPVSPHDIQVVIGKQEAPDVSFFRPLKKSYRIFASVSHEQETVVACVVSEI